VHIAWGVVFRDYMLRTEPLCKSCRPNSPSFFPCNQQAAMDLKEEAGIKHLEVLGVDGGGGARQQHYKPVSEEEKALDRQVNFKLDLFVTLVLAIGFIVSLSNSSPLLQS
jgi:hypothetical protein